MIFKERITPQEIEELPMADFEGEIGLIEKVGSEYYSALEYLRAEKIIGFDTETRPSFTSNSKRNGVALLQLSGKDKAYVFRLQQLGLPNELKALLASTRVVKVGAAVHDDIKALQRLSPFVPRNFTDLQSIAINWGIQEKSVRKLSAIILGLRVSKSQQLSNWESAELTDAQLNYAAIDAWVCQKMYLKLLSIPKVNNQNVKSISKEG